MPSLVEALVKIPMAERRMWPTPSAICPYRTHSRLIEDVLGHNTQTVFLFCMNKEIYIDMTILHSTFGEEKSDQKKRKIHLFHFYIVEFGSTEVGMG